MADMKIALGADGTSAPLTTVRVTRTYQDARGVPITVGAPKFKLSSAISNGGSESVMPTSIVCSINSTGELLGPDGEVGVLLTATNDPQVQPQGVAYLVSGEPAAGPWALLLNVADAPTVDLASKMPASAGPVYQVAIDAADVVESGVTAASIGGATPAQVTAAVTAEATRAEGAETANAAAIAAEAARAKAAEALLVPLAELTSAPSTSFGAGAPVVTSTCVANDGYLDVNTGNVYTFNGTAWVLETTLAVGPLPFNPSSFGYAATTLPITGNTSNTGLYGTGSPSTYRGYWMRIRAFESVSVQHFDYTLLQAAAGLITGTNGNGIGLWDSGQATAGTATLLGFVDCTNLWESQSTGPNTASLATPVALTKGQDYFVSMTSCQPASGQTSPSFAGVSDVLFPPNGVPNIPVLGIYGGSLPLPAAIPFNEFYSENTMFQVALR